MNEILHAVQSWINAVPSGLWRASWQGGLAIVAAWAVARWCRFVPPRAVCWVWRLACLKLLVSLMAFSAVPIPLLPPDELPEVALPSTTASHVATGSQVGAGPQVTAGAVVAAPNIEFATRRTPVAEASPVPQAPREHWNWLSLVWVAGAASSMWLTGRRWKSVQRLCSTSQPLENAALEKLCREEADRVHLKRSLQFRSSPDANVPLLAGIWRPQLLLPAAATESFADAELRLILAHELAHLQRRDLLWNWLPTIAAWLFFFHPLVWLLKRGWADAQESACDELVLQNAAGHAVPYARLLIKVAGRWPRNPSVALMAAGVLGTDHNLMRRILIMTHVKPVSRCRLRAVALMAFLVAAIGIIPWRLVAQEPTTGKPATPINKSFEPKGEPARALPAEPGKTQSDNSGEIPRDAKLNDAKLNTVQRNFRDLTEKSFSRILDPTPWRNLPARMKSSVEEKMLKQLASDDEGERVVAINGLVALGSKKAVPALLKIAAERVEKDNRDRWMAARALGILGDNSMVSELAQLTYHYNLNTRMWAQISLVRLTGENFGRDVAAWRQWWAKQGGKPPISEQRVAWATSPEGIRWSDPKKMDEVEREFAAAEPTTKAGGSDSFNALTNEAESGDYWAQYRLWAAYREGASGVAKNPEKAKHWLGKLVEGNYLATFRPINGFSPKTPGELLEEFEKHGNLRSEPNGVGGASFFRTRADNGVLIGSFITTYPDKMQQAIADNANLKLVSIEKLTPEMFARHDASPQESLDAN